MLERHVPAHITRTSVVDRTPLANKISIAGPSSVWSWYLRTGSLSLSLPLSLALSLSLSLSLFVYRPLLVCVCVRGCGCVCVCVCVFRVTTV